MLLPLLYQSLGRYNMCVYMYVCNHLLAQYSLCLSLCLNWTGTGKSVAATPS
jgi:hypothetical protein